MRYNKENVSEKINKRSLLAIAKDLILTEATNSKTHGFMIIWQDGINFADHDYAISIYLLNPFVFIPRALENDFILNEESELFKFIYNYISEEGIDKIPSSVYKIGRRAKEYLSKYYNPDWEMASTWELDLFEDELYKFQRLPIIFDSWGLIGEFVREYYLSNAAQQGYFTPKELITNPYGYLQPLAGLQIINNLCGISLFTNGHYLVSDIFRFGKQICQYLYVCHNCLNTTEDKEISNNASLFWNNLLIINSIREIQLRLFDIKKSFESPPKFTLYHSKFAIPEDYKAKILEFNSWFSKNFIGNHEVHRIIFQFACNYGLYFNELYRKVLSKKDEIVVQDEIGSFVKHVLKDVISRIKNNGLALNEEGVSNLEYMLGNISNQDEEELIGRINKLSNIFFISVFEEYILKILDNVFGEIIHELSQFNFSNSVDWNWIASKTKENFHKKMRYTVFEITPNNRMILRQLSDEEVLALPKLTSEEEIYVKFYPYSGRSMILKEKLENLVSGKFFKKVFE